MKNEINNSDAKIGNNSNNNTVIQNSVIKQTIISQGSNDILDCLANSGNYTAINNIISQNLRCVERYHPLYPDFTAKYDNQLKRLISTPETDDAFKKFPQTLKGEITVDYTKYPYMQKFETPWEYAYRTQTEVEINSCDLKSYLGDKEDPYPRINFKDASNTVIMPPPFPDAIDAEIISGSIKVPIKIRRIPCLDYGKVVFSNININVGFDLTLSFEKDHSVLSLTRIHEGNLQELLLREELFYSIYINEKFKIALHGEEFLSQRVAKTDNNQAFYSVTPYLIKYYRTLVEIEKKFGCKFCITDATAFTEDEFNFAMFINSSINDKWYHEKIEMDKTIRCNYNNIHNINIINDNVTCLIVKANDVLLKLYGVTFSAKQLLIKYYNAKINNIESIQKNIKRKKNNILITIKPIDGKSNFDKYVKLQEISVVEF